MDIRVYRREVYGNIRYYPADERADTLLQLTGTKTFTPEMLKTIEQVGLKVIKVRNYRSDNHKSEEV